jgi:glycosyltransferase involved in cell wall biosynthesis
VDAVAEGVTGFLVPPRNAGELALALRRLVENPALRATFGSAARERARMTYRAAPALLALQSMYDTLLERAVA